MNNQPPSPRKIPLMEYVFLLPAILFFSPMISAVRQAQSSEVPIYAFRLFLLAYLLLMMSLILFYARPSMLRRQAWSINLLRSSLFGIIALAPIVLFGLALSGMTSVEYELFGALELTAGWFGLLIAMMVNIALLVYVVRAQLLSSCTTWAVLSVVVHVILLLMLLWLW